MVAGMMINRFKSTFEEADLDKNGAVSYQGQSRLTIIVNNPCFWICTLGWKLD